MSARASATRWRWPPESWDGCRLPNSPSSTRNRYSSTLDLMMLRPSFRALRGYPQEPRRLRRGASGSAGFWSCLRPPAPTSAGRPRRLPMSPSGFAAQTVDPALPGSRAAGPVSLGVHRPHLEAVERPLGQLPESPRRQGPVQDPGRMIGNRGACSVAHLVAQDSGATIVRRRSTSAGRPRCRPPLPSGFAARTGEDRASPGSPPPALFPGRSPPAPRSCRASRWSAAGKPST